MPIEINPGVSSKTFTIVYHKTSSSSISDLTGTKWIIKDSPDTAALDNMSYAINFTSNSKNFDLISFSREMIRYAQTSTSTIVVPYHSETPIGGGGLND